MLVFFASTPKARLNPLRSPSVARALERSMTHLNLLFLGSLTLAGCAQGDCTNDDCATPGDPQTMDLGHSFIQARRRLQADGLTLPHDIDERVVAEIEPELRPRCQALALLITRWNVDHNEFDGVIINRWGHAIADVDGRFAPFQPSMGTLAGGYTVTPYAEVDPDERDAEAILPATEGTHGTLGGAYRDNNHFAAQISRGPASLPVRGVWRQVSDQGGYAIGVVLACHSDDELTTNPGAEPVRPDTTIGVDSIID